MKSVILPDEKVVAALLESYLTMRCQSKWSGKLSNAPRQKIDACTKLLTRFSEAKNFNDWVESIYLCAELEHYEDMHKTGNLLFGFAKYFVDVPLLLLTFRAILTYMIFKLSQNSDYNKLKDDLILQKTKIEANNKTDPGLLGLNTKINALNYFTAEDDHESFFRNIIHERYKQEDELNEVSFADFEKNALSGKRKFNLCDELLKDIKVTPKAAAKLKYIDNAKLEVIVNDPTCENMQFANKDKPRDKKPLPESALNAHSIFNNSAFAQTKKFHEYNLRKQRPRF